MKKKFLVPTLLAVGAMPVMAQTTSALETAADTAIDGLATTAGALLVAALAIVVAFAVYKIVKRAVGKA